MGCGNTKETIESEMLLIKLERIKIRDERELILNRLQTETGKNFKRIKIPDYVDHEAMKEIKKKKKHNKMKKNKNQDSGNSKSTKNSLLMSK
jgi:hypothetical protein